MEPRRRPTRPADIIPIMLWTQFPPAFFSRPFCCTARSHPASAYPTQPQQQLHAHTVEDDSIPPPLTPPAHFGYLSPTLSDSGNSPADVVAPTSNNKQVELEMGLHEAQQQAHLEDLHQQQSSRTSGA